MLPSQFADLSAYPSISRFVQLHFDMQFDDIRGMMKLPRPRQGITGGCNFAAALGLCNLVAGAAVVLYEKPRGYPGTGNGFVALLMQFYPWSHGETPQSRAEILYNLVRNPLAHSIGTGRTPGQRRSQIRIEKRALRERELRRLELATVRPAHLPTVVTFVGSEYRLSVISLYWGVIQLFRGLFRDTHQMTATQRRLQQEGW